MSRLTATTVESIFTDHKQFVWGLCYRLTGSAADADDLVQDTFVRAMERPPARTNEPWRPWLVRVAMNLGRDALRRRRRRSYIGPWLPSPIETSDATDEASPPSYEIVAEGGLSTEGRYDLIESVSFAFLLALEALTPQQRAVLLLRDVFDYSVRETAAALGITEPNVKTVHHRARRRMRSYDQDRCIPTRELQARNRQALERFMMGLASQDIGALEALLREDVTTHNDGGGEFLAARVPILGRDRVLRFYLNLSQGRLADVQAEMRLINGLPAYVISLANSHEKEAPRFVIRCDTSPDGRITAVHSVLATRKLTAVRF
jgi:RNA polymerase sigma-70 factor (ECF subfamily)